jgi:DNA-binding CsgD family transcriptional regulator
VRALSAHQIAERLDGRFDVLGSSARGVLSRHHTLEATVRWSYDLLSEGEQRLLRSLAVFAGPWTLEDAEAVCLDDDWHGSLLDVLVRLVDKSLVLAEDGPDGEKSYRLLEPIRHFALEWLRSAAEERTARERHFRWYLDLAERADRVIRWTPDLPWRTRQKCLDRLARGYANMRTANQWVLETGQAEDGLRLATALFTFFWTTGHLSEGRDWLANQLYTRTGAPPTAERAWAISVAAKLAAHHGDDAAARLLAAEYLAMPSSTWTGPATAHVHTALGLAALRQGDLPNAREHATLALAESVASGESAVPLYRTYLAAVAVAEGHLDEASKLFQKALAEGRAIDFPLPIGIALDGLGRIARERGDRDRARVLYEEALGVLRAVGDMPQIALVLVALGHLALEEGDAAVAYRRFRESLELATTLGHRESLVATLHGIALALARAGARDRSPIERSIRLLGAAQRLSEGLRRGRPLDPAAHSVIAQARKSLGTTRTDALMTEGRSLSLDEAVADAKMALAQEEGATPRVATPSTPRLTRREREVAILVARGCSNGQIAEILVIGKRTAEMHVGRLLAKLGMASRAQLAVWAAGYGMLQDDVSDHGARVAIPSAEP